MEKKEIEKKVFEIIKSNIDDIAESEISLDSKLTKDIGADSLDLANVIMNIEEEYNILFPEYSEASHSLKPMGFPIGK